MLTEQEIQDCRLETIRDVIRYAMTRFEEDSFGHGIGMNIHEAIYVSPKSTQKLQAGNVVSAEPGIYLPGIGGIRIEDTVLITEDGYRLLTDYDHSYTVV